METRQLGLSDLHLTTIGFGTWAIGGDNWNMGWGQQDDQDSIRAIQRALDIGINWIDTAPIYGMGHAEEVVGKAIAGRRDKVILATKFNLIWDNEKRKVTNNLKPESIRREIEDSLRRLAVDVIDLIQIHVPFPDNELEGAWDFVSQLIKEGKIRFGGVSNCSLEQLKRLQVIHPITSLQPAYSMLHRDIEPEIMGYCAANHIGLIVYGPMQSGLLTGKFDREKIKSLEASDWRKKDKDFIEPRFSINLEFINKLRPIAEQHGKKLSHLAIAWVLSHPQVTSAIVGARNPGQIEENAGGADWELTTEALSEIETLIIDRDRQLGMLDSKNLS